MTEEKLGFFELMLKSMFDFSFYKQFVDAPIKKTIIYIVLFGLFIGSLSMIKYTVYYNDYFTDIKEDFGRRVPEFQIIDGVLVMDEETSFIRKENAFEFVIDSNLTSNAVEMSEKTGIYMTKDAFVLKSILNNDVIPYEGYSSDMITKTTIIEYLNFFKNVTLGMMLVFGTLFGMLGKVINSLFVSGIGFVINRVNNYQMSFKKIYQVGAHALTFPSIVAMLADIFLMSMPFFTVLYFFVIFMYYTKILRVLNEEAV